MPLRSHTVNYGGYCNCYRLSGQLTIITTTATTTAATAAVPSEECEATGCRDLWAEIFVTREGDYAATHSISFVPIRLCLFLANCLALNFHNRTMAHLYQIPFRTSFAHPLQSTRQNNRFLACIRVSLAGPAKIPFDDVCVRSTTDWTGLEWNVRRPITIFPNTLLSRIPFHIQWDSVAAFYCLSLLNHCECKYCHLEPFYRNPAHNWRQLDA